MRNCKRWIALVLATMLLFTLTSVVASAASGDTVVYRTKTGSCYHTEGCSYLKKSSIKITLQGAVNSGLTPCSRCHPPTLDSSGASRSAPVALGEIDHDLLRMKQQFFGSGTQFLVTVTATCKKNNSVGDDWTTEFSVAGFSIRSGDVVAFNQEDGLEIITTITEKSDGKDDIGKKKTTLTVSDKDFTEGFTVTQSITVKENSGKHKGNTAKWEVEYKFTRYQS